MSGRKISPEVRDQIWRRWKLGESLSEIGRALSRNPATIFHLLRREGGFAPRARVRDIRSLHLREREEISRGIARGATVREIARALERAPSSISRELRRNGGRESYRACRAEQAAWHRARRPKPYRLACNPRLRELVQQKLQERWSPEQISGWLASSFADDKSMRVSPETIYRSLFIQARGLLKQELIKQLRRKRPMRMPRAASTRVQPSQILDAVHISERPPEVQDRAVPGHWEGDLLAGSKNTHIATLVERHSRFLMLVKLQAKDTHTVVNALTRHVRKLPKELRRSLTWDRGVELKRAQALHPRDRCAGVLLRSEEPLAARQQREHQRTAASVLPQGDRPLRPLPIRPRPGRSPNEPAPSQDLGLRHSRG